MHCLHLDGIFQQEIHFIRMTLLGYLEVDNEFYEVEARVFCLPPLCEHCFRFIGYIFIPRINDSTIV